MLVYYFLDADGTDDAGFWCFFFLENYRPQRLGRVFGRAIPASADTVVRQMPMRG